MTTFSAEPDLKHSPWQRFELLNALELAIYNHLTMLSVSFSIFQHT